ncbi:MAG: aminoacyl-tRNA hydrolase [Deltaproteobacteria bacterium]|nr:aminoacyl-tRNA hydrolase [Deltaproteobacteria bacterium]MBW2151904.1 aminoacyl-tRNA hydrolase [Deltaproteobacteria bacterium]
MDSQGLWLIVGLGNPGDAYAQTRHNAGFMVADEVAAAYSIPLHKSAFDSVYGQGVIEGKRVIIVKPMAYMNRSGPSVKKMAKRFKISSRDMLVIHDDIDLAYGRLKIKEKGGDGGHKGLRSIIDAFGCDEFPRIRIGIGRSASEATVTEHVLGAFSATEKKILARIIERARDAVITVLVKGTKEAMNRFNTKRNLILSMDGGEEWNL